MSEGAPDSREPKLARRSPFVPVSKLCPRCLTPLKEVTRSLQGWVPLNYYCANCGYSGSVYFEKDADQGSSQR